LNVVQPRSTAFTPHPAAQLLLDGDAWRIWRIPYFNSFSYDLAGILMSLTSALTAIYFIGSALRARRYLSKHSADLSARDLSGDADQKALRRLMRRVLASGCLMLVTTIVLAIGLPVLLHPIGFTVLCGIMFPIMMANSLLQIDSFAPAIGVPIGPLREICHAMSHGVDRLMNRGMEWIASSSSANPVVRAVQKRRSTRADSGADANGSALLREVSRFEHPEQSPTDAPSDDHLKPWERPGVSARFLEAFVITHKITRTMTTTDVMERIIKPETATRKCCYVELLSSDDRCPPQWLGKTTHFASHW